MVTVPSWKPVPLMDDEFFEFDQIACINLSKIISITNAEIVLSSTHRINYFRNEWVEIFRTRGINISTISKINDVGSIQEMTSRRIEIETWIQNNPNEEYIIIDDDASLNGLINKDRLVKTNSMTGFNKECYELAVDIVNG